MSTTEIYSPELGPDFSDEPIKETDFQIAMDELFQNRVPKIIPVIGRMLLEPTDLTNRTRSHITSAETHFVPADTARTEDALKHFRSGVANLAEFTNAIEKNTRNLKDYPELIVATPHTGMSDILIATYGLHHTSIMDGKDATDITMPLSALLGHTIFKPTGQNVTTGIVAPVCNVVPVLPATKSVKPLKDKFSIESSEYNKQGLDAIAEHKKTKQDTQQILPVAPSAAKARPYRGIYNRLQTIPDSSYTGLRSSHRQGAAILIMSCDIFPMAFVKGFPKQRIRFSIPRVILPEEELGKDKNAFKNIIWENLVKAGRASSIRPIWVDS